MASVTDGERRTAGALTGTQDQQEFSKRTEAVQVVVVVVSLIFALDWGDLSVNVCVFRCLNLIRGPIEFCLSADDDDDGVGRSLTLSIRLTYTCGGVLLPPEAPFVRPCQSGQVRE